MRKVRPEDVRITFQSDVQELAVYLNRTRRAIEADEGQKADVSRLMSTSFLSLYVAFERFVSDLFLAYMNRDFVTYQHDLAEKVRQSVHERFGDFAQSRTKFESVRHVALANLEDIVDPSGRNLTFKNAAAIKEGAARWLAPPHAAGFLALSAHDDRLIDTAHSIRDFIVHESPAAKSAMNANLATVGQAAHNQYLGRGTNQVHNVGSYLKAVFDGRRRIAIYSGRLVEIADIMQAAA